MGAQTKIPDPACYYYGNKIQNDLRTARDIQSELHIHAVLSRNRPVRPEHLSLIPHCERLQDEHQQGTEGVSG